MAANRFAKCVGREVRAGRTFKQGVAHCKHEHRTRSGRRHRRSRSR